MKYSYILVFILFISFSAKSQTDTSNIQKRESALNIYFDCNSCDMTYFRQHFTLVNYVRDRLVADVHIMVTEMENGGGGNEFTIQFIGQGKYSSMSDTLILNTKADATDDEERKAILNIIQRGLVPFILKTDYANRIEINYIDEENENETKDPWNNWIFQIASQINIDGQQSYKSFNSNTAISASRITEKIKHHTRISQSYSENKYRIYNDSDSLIYSLDAYSSSFFAFYSTIWSINDHWGAGVEGNIWTSTYSNTKNAWDVMPAIEYNLYKYQEASRRQLRISYAAGFTYMNYNDTTIYNKIHDNLYYHKMEAHYKQITKWGSFSGSLNYKNYLHDFSLYYLGASISTSIRLFKGLSLSFYGDFSLPRNQVGLVKSTTTTEQVLLQQQELKTQYSYYTSIGLSYTFGSIYNNVVNTRLD